MSGELNKLERFFTLVSDLLPVVGADIVRAMTCRLVHYSESWIPLMMSGRTKQVE